MESHHAQERDPSAFALTANVQKVNVSQSVIRIAVVDRSSVLQSVEMPTANVGQTVSANQISVPQSARRDAVAMTRDLARSYETWNSLINPRT